MSVMKMVILRCDGPLIEEDGCYSEPSSITADLAGLPETVGEARRLAREDGWARSRDGQDYCPPCQEARKEVTR